MSDFQFPEKGHKNHTCCWNEFHLWPAQRVELRPVHQELQLDLKDQCWSEGSHKFQKSPIMICATLTSFKSMLLQNEYFLLNNTANCTAFTGHRKLTTSEVTVIQAIITYLNHKYMNVCDVTPSLTAHLALEINIYPWHCRKYIQKDKPCLKLFFQKVTHNIMCMRERQHYLSDGRGTGSVLSEVSSGCLGEPS